ncbi:MULTISPECIES: lysophospholipid acyltransferase family protein [unclassified Brevibacterium]|uniref:lysophospholipid acyltransferase family protein n=1 Tax=unclassified Brevibacterium TaxID=2614124 RepID=UPI001E552A1A|nr:MULTISPECIES: lysophospholipid acyltransferase family protein [unclassified Brevibacterium]MCD1284822.1 1-acyl-sn-glycerol-3-phosphate acyltransferase [Brevibacterium sp. CCUG 69071]MDK8435557.1 lysophospholipid acyltransferase family protein [Brevibacterium sp. H-BE7]
MFYWFLKRVLAGPILRILFRPWVRGLDNLPSDGPAIIAGNHNHFMDSIFVPLLAPRPVVYLAKKDYFTGRGIKGAVTRWFFKLNNQLPMDRGGGSGSQASLESGLKVLGEGNSLGIYPEGTRSPDGKLYRGRTGIARLVLESGAPVIPVAIIGTDKLQPAGRLIPKLRRVGVVFGSSMDFSKYEGLPVDRFLLRSITDEIMYEIMRLSGQEYVDAYASTVKTKLLTSAKPKKATKSADAEDGQNPPTGDAQGAEKSSDTASDEPRDATGGRPGN